MSTNQKVQCCTHSEMNYALVCTHLANQAENAEPVTYYVADDDSDPDRSSVENIWCDSCDDVLIREGDWNDVSEAHADIKVICIACLEQIKNTILQRRSNKLINKDKKQLAVFVPQHFSQQFFAHY